MVYDVELQRACYHVQLLCAQGSQGPGAKAFCHGYNISTAAANGGRSLNQRSCFLLQTKW